MLSNKIRKLVREWRNGGPARVWSLFVRRLGLVHLVILRHTNSAGAKPADTTDGYTFAFAQETQCADLATCAAETPEEHTHLTALYRELFANGHRCAVAIHDGKIVGQVWAFAKRYVITIDNYRYTRLPLELDEHSVFTGNAYIAQPHRNRGLFRRLKLFLMSQYPPGMHFYTWIDRVNKASLAANRALGFEQIATLRFFGNPAHAQLSLQHTGDGNWTPLRRPWPTLQILGATLQSSI